MADTIKVEGSERLSRTLDGAAKDLETLSKAQPEVGRQVIRAADIPRVSGRLAASVTSRPDANTVEILSQLPYAGVIHWGWPARNIVAQPFLLDAARRSEPAWTRTYEKAAQDVLNTVKGA